MTVYECWENPLGDDGTALFTSAEQAPMYAEEGEIPIYSVRADTWEDAIEEHDFIEANCREFSRAH